MPDCVGAGALEWDEGDEGDVGDVGTDVGLVGGGGGGTLGLDPAYNGGPGITYVVWV